MARSDKENNKSKKIGSAARVAVTRGRIALGLMLIVMAVLVGRFAYLQLVDPNDYRVAALDQYTSSVTISAKRGSIYASDGTTELAVSATVYNCFISPYDIESEEQLQLIASELSAILSVDRSEIIEKGKKTKSKYQIIKKFLSETEETAVRQLIKEQKLEKVIALEETTKRYYRFATFASHLLGFTGSDNQGLAGIEFTYDSYLKGVDGREVKAADAYGNKLETGVGSTYVAAQNGLNVVTTIDWQTQNIVEKYIKQAYAEHKPNGRVSCIVMNVDNGEILAWGIYPNFDLNNYNTLSEEYQRKYDLYVDTPEKRAEYKTKLLYDMWNNSIAAQTYEPGSTFKIITTAMALEEGVVTPESHFVCRAAISVGGLTIHCHSRAGHGDQALAQALVNSCNPAFVQIGSAVGYERFLKYFDEFGYTKLSGSDIVGEASSIYLSKLGPVELAVYSFGQTFKVTMVQHIRAVSAVANGGYLVVPHVVKSLVDGNGNVVKTFDYQKDRQVVSTEVCNWILNTLTDSTKNASVSGYHIVSKTGTSEKRDTARTDDYISSCLSLAPAEDPKIAILVTVDEPTGGQHFGSAVAAPIVSQILTEVLPHLGITPAKEEETTLIVQDYRGSHVSEAKAVIEGFGLKCVVKGSGADVTDQMPRPDSVIATDGVVILYTGGETITESVRVPNLIGNSPTTAIKSLTNSDLNIVINGIFNNEYRNCSVVAQSVPAGSYVAPGTVVELTFRYEEAIE